MHERHTMILSMTGGVIDRNRMIMLAWNSATSSRNTHSDAVVDFVKLCLPAHYAVNVYALIASAMQTAYGKQALMCTHLLLS